MFLKKRMFAKTALCFLLFLGSGSCAAYQEASSQDDWSDFDQQMLEEYRRSAYRAPPKVKPIRRFGRANKVLLAPKPQVKVYQAPPKVKPISRPAQATPVLRSPKAPIPKAPIKVQQQPSLLKPTSQSVKANQVTLKSKGAIKPANNKLIVKKPSIIAKYLPTVVTLSVGPAFEQAGETQTLQLTPTIRKTYTSNNESNTLVNGGIFLGYRQAGTKFDGQLGLEFAAMNGAGLSGEVWDDADPEFNNYTYSYQVRNARLALKGKLLPHTSFYTLKPFISASAGIGFNQARSFDNVPLIYEAVVMPNFASKTSTSFAYTVGLGIQKELGPNVQAGVGYEFASWGKSQLGTALGQSLGDGGLSLNQLYTNGILFHITYLR